MESITLMNLASEGKPWLHQFWRYKFCQRRRSSLLTLGSSGR